MDGLVVGGDEDEEGGGGGDVCGVAVDEVACGLVNLSRS